MYGGNSHRLLVVFFVCLALVRSAFAEDISLQLSGEQNATQGKAFTVSVNATSTNESKSVAGAAFTVKYDAAVLTFVKTTSSFFETFAAQGITPASVIVDGVTYSQPLITNNQSLGKAMVAAVSAKAKTIPTGSITELFQLQFTVKENASAGTSSITLHQSTISNTSAGYATGGEAIPVLMGATDTGPYPSFTVAFSDHTVHVAGKGDLDGDGLIDENEKLIYGTNPLKADTDGDGLSDGEEINIHHTAPLRADTDGDGALDGHEVKAGTLPTSSASVPDMGLEVGELSVTSDWQSVSYMDGVTYNRPVVVAKPASNNEAESVIIQIRKVTSTGFEIRLKETSTLSSPGGAHAVEHVGYMVMESGSFIFMGVRVTAGIIRAQQRTTNLLQVFRFPVVSRTTPVVMASVTTANEAEVPVNVRVSDMTTRGFSYLLQEEQKEHQFHGVENISYIAWEPSLTLVDGYVIEVGRKTAVVGNLPYTFSFAQAKSEVPVLLADMQSATDKDPAGLRCDALSATGATVHVAEDVSRDAETTHAKESLGYIAFAATTSVDTDGDGLTDEEEQLIYGTDPLKADTDGDGLPDGEEINTPPWTGRRATDLWWWPSWRATTRRSMWPTW